MFRCSPWACRRSPAHARCGVKDYACPFTPRIESSATASRIATLDLPAGIVTGPSPAADTASGTPPTERV